MNTSRGRLSARAGGRLTGPGTRRTVDGYMLGSRGVPPSKPGRALISSFSWRRFSAISLWILVLFLIYVTASEFNQLLGPAEMRRLLFARRPSDLQLNRRQRARELLRLNRLSDEHRGHRFHDPPHAAPHHPD